ACVIRPAPSTTAAAAACQASTPSPRVTRAAADETGIGVIEASSSSRHLYIAPSGGPTPAGQKTLSRRARREPWPGAPDTPSTMTGVPRLSCVLFGLALPIV